MENSNDWKPGKWLRGRSLLKNLFYSKAKYEELTLDRGIRLKVAYGTLESPVRGFMENPLENLWDVQITGYV